MRLLNDRHKGILYIENAFELKNNKVYADGKQVPIGNYVGVVVKYNADIDVLAIQQSYKAWTPICILNRQGGGTSGVSYRERKNNLLEDQVFAYTNRTARLKVAKNLLEFRYGEGVVSKAKSINEVRGKEGYLTANFYNRISKEYDIEWVSRKKTPVISQKISRFNTLLYRYSFFCCIHIGLLPQLGFIHAGNNHSFVYDLADLYKNKTAIELAFEFDGKQNQTELIQAFNEKINTYKITKNMYKNIKGILRV